MNLAYSLVILALAFRDVCCAAVDKPEPKTPADKSVNAAAGPGVAVAVLGEFITKLIPDIASLFNEKEGQCKFVDQLTAKLFLEYRDLNVVVYSSLESDDADLVGKVCYLVDMPLAFWRKEEYRVCVFETGRFTLAGEDKCEIWGYRGCTAQANGKTVTFCRVRGATGAPESSTAAQTTATDRSSTTKSSVASSKDSAETSSTTSSRPRDTTTSAQPTAPSQPGGGGSGTAATSTSAPPSPPPAVPPTSAGGNANTGAATTGGQRSAGSTGGPAMFGVLAAVMVGLMAMV